MGHASALSRFDRETQLGVGFFGGDSTGLYHFGALIALQEQMLDLRLNAVCGVASGAIAATILVARVQPEQVLKYHFPAALSNIAKLNPNKWSGFLQEILPDDIHVIASGKLFLFAPRGVVSEFQSKGHLIQTVLESHAMPTWRLSTSVERSKLMTDLFELLGFKSPHRIITVSPFAGDAHICPKDDYAQESHLSRIRLNGGLGLGVDLTASNARRLFSSAFRSGSRLYQIEQVRGGYRDAREYLTSVGLADWEKQRPIQDDLFTYRKTMFSAFFAILRITERAEKSRIGHPGNVAVALICKLIMMLGMILRIGIRVVGTIARALTFGKLKTNPLKTGFDKEKWIESGILCIAKRIYPSCHIEEFDLKSS